MCIPGMGKDNNRSELVPDNYKRYSHMVPGTTVGGTVSGYKRSHSLLSESQHDVGKTRLPRASLQ